MSEKTIPIYLLSDRAIKRIEKDDEDENYDWYARPHGRGYSVKAVEKSLVGLFVAQGGLDEGWLPIVFHDD